MEANWFDQLILLGALQGFILAIVIWSKKAGNKNTLSILSTIVVLTSIILIGKVFFTTASLKRFWAVYTYADTIIFLFGPLIYFFTASILGKSLPKWSKISWHFIPALIHLLVFNTILSLAALDVITSMKRIHFSVIYYSMEFFAILSLGLYLWKSIQLFNQNEVDHYNSQSSPLLTSFLKPFLYIFSGLTAIWALGFVLKFVEIIPGDEGIVYYGFWILIAISIYLMTYKILLSPEVLTIKNEKAALPSDAKPKIDVEDEALIQSKNELAHFMESSKIYQNSKLSLEELAQAQQISRHELSRIINQGFGKNFFDLINSYRVEAFIQKIEANNNLTFLEVAFEVGFNSKSAFNRAFRKETGTSPSDYFKNLPKLQKA